jgi:very-short-patch-repair endonuclease
MACRQILAACHRGESPTLRLPRAEQVRQYALAIEPRRLLVLIAVVNPPTAHEHLTSLAQGAEWLANNSQSRVVLVLSSELTGRTELDHVTYDSCVFVDHRCDTLPPSDAIEADDVIGPHPGARAQTEREPVSESEPAVSVSPIVGRPAKHSDSEQALYRELTADKALRGLFAYNQNVTTHFGSMPIVDLLWEAGKLVIEIDGDDHRRFGKYSSDRKRDYELALSGYMVIRFTSSRVIENMSSVLHAIREAVRYRSERDR